MRQAGIRRASLLPPTFVFENHLWDHGVRYIAGIDEAGRGALAGPVAAGAVIFDRARIDEQMLRGVRDSKLMTPQARKSWARHLTNLAHAWAIGFATAQEIDRYGILAATRIAIQRALNTLAVPPDYLLIDYLLMPENITPQTAIVKGDRLSLSIAAASVLAKYARDLKMIAFHQEYPDYGFNRHKGYGTSAHRQAIFSLGICPIHRHTFAPIKDALLPMRENPSGFDAGNHKILENSIS